MIKDKALDTMGATLDDWLDKKNMAHLIDQIYNDHEAQIKAKDEEIAELKLDFDMLKESESYFFHALIDERQQRLSLLDCLKKERKKARLIVAMLFWKWKRAKNGYWRPFQEIECFEEAFYEAYAILKDKK